MLYINESKQNIHCLNIDKRKSPGDKMAISEKYINIEYGWQQIEKFILLTTVENEIDPIAHKNQFYLIFISY